MKSLDRVYEQTPISWFIYLLIKSAYTYDCSNILFFLPGKAKIVCVACQKKCSGEVLRVTEKYFHKGCFQCKKCKKSLAQGGFFTKDGGYYCITDYQQLFGTKCAVCNEYVEGEVVQTMGKTFHQKCFTCSRCKKPFQSGAKVTNTGKETLCELCVSGVNLTPKRKEEAVQKTTAHQQEQHAPKVPVNDDPNSCAGCGNALKEGQALIALDRQWHIWCFKCNACHTQLNAEYMGKDGVPYCEKDYQKLFGVKCAYCLRFISGKVLQAGDNHHFHPTCARCTKCGDPFGDGEEMYLQGGAIWHPRCGPGPLAEFNGTIIGGTSNGHFTDNEIDRISNSASELQVSVVFLFL